MFDKKAWTKISLLVTNSKIIMSLLLSVGKRLILPVLLGAFPSAVWSQISAVPQGGETAIIGGLPGDQVHADLSLNQNGGYVVWEENGSKKTGLQISAARLDSAFNKIATFTVNKITTRDQVNPQVQLLNGGNAIFIWQSYGLKNADIYARILKDDGSFATRDIRVNSAVKPKGSYSDDQQSHPVVCALQDGSAFVAWQSFGQDGSMFGIYATRISPDGKVAVMGEPVTLPTRKKKKTFTPNEFQVNQRDRFNQRSPAIATLANGNVIVVWISELQRFGNEILENGMNSAPSVDVYARLFSPSGAALSGDLLLNSGNNVCANPAVASLTNGGFTVVWSERDALSESNSWDVIGRSFSPDGAASGADFKINTHTYRDQYNPEIIAVGNDCAVIWTSMSQDGSGEPEEIRWKFREGVYGRILQGGTQPVGDEFRVNTTTIGRQLYPAIASDGAGRFLVVWSGFVAGTSFDLFSQTYSVTQQP
jgi:hypothetical protein